MAENNKKDNQTTDTSKTRNENAPDYEHMDYEETPELNPNVNPDQEVTPGNVQAPIDEADKHRQDDVLLADHVEQGFPANEVPRTDEERKRMEQAGIIDKDK